HTRSKRDWSSDVCSSDLIATGRIADRAHDTAVEEAVLLTDPAAERHFDLHLPGGHASKRRTDRRVEALPRKTRPDPALEIGIGRSEERRVGKEWRWSGGA